jgi:hypothetical protein
MTVQKMLFAQGCPKQKALCIFDSYIFLGEAIRSQERSDGEGW